MAELIARGDVALGFQQLSELLHAPGIDVVGVLRRRSSIQRSFPLASAWRRTDSGAARTLLDFLASPQAEAIKRRHGMEPA